MVFPYVLCQVAWRYADEGLAKGVDLLCRSIVIGSFAVLASSRELMEENVCLDTSGIQEFSGVSSNRESRGSVMEQERQHLIEECWSVQQKYTKVKVYQGFV